MKHIVITNYPSVWVFWFGYSGFLLFAVALGILAYLGMRLMRQVSKLNKTADALQRNIDRDVMPNVNAINANVDKISSEIESTKTNVTDAAEKVTHLVEEVRSSPTFQIAGTISSLVTAARILRGK